MPSILVTGVSSGIGHALAAKAAAEGWTVVGTVRKGKEEDAPLGIDVRNLELSDFRDVRRLVAGVLADRGCPDVLVNNAGTVIYGSVEDTPVEEMRRLFDVNVFGAIELIDGFLPAMRERGSGLIVNVTSLGGRMTFPFFAAYNASKHAMEGFSEGLWHELRPFGIRVKAVEPGYVQTPIYEKSMRADGREREAGEPYRRFQAAMTGFAESLRGLTTPERAAEEAWRAIIDPSDRLRYPVAAYARALTRARRWLGELRVMRFFHGRWLGKY